MNKIKVDIKSCFIVFCFIFISIVFLPKGLYASEEKPTVLILNSYHKGFVWTDEQTEGIINKLRENNIDIQVSVEYMDWKKYPQEKNKDALYEYYHYKYSEKHLAMVITTDDVALEFALDNRKSVFSNAPVVFSGVNEQGFGEIASDSENVTGIIEYIDTQKTMQVALNISPDLENLYILYDNSESGLSSGQLIVEAVQSLKPDINIITLNQYNLQGILEKIKKASTKSAIFIATYTMDKEGIYIDYEKFSELISIESSIPVFQLYDFGMGYGAIGGSMLSGKLTGNSVGQLASEILMGKNIGEIKPYIAQTTHNVFDYNQLEKFNIAKDILPIDSEIINLPFSFFQTYKIFVYSVIGIMLLLIFFIILLYSHNKGILKMKNKLAESNEELTQIYEELTASEEELRMQIGEMEVVQNDLLISKKQLQQIAYFDALTQLPNRFSLRRKMDKITKQNSKSNIAMLFIDIDNFKYINDTLGHSVGDKLIRGAAKRMNDLIEEDCKVYRLGGDEFIILIEGTKYEKEVVCIANKILDEFHNSFKIEENLIYITISIGISLFPQHGENIEELLENADIAMYKAKNMGKNTYAMFDESLKNVIIKRMKIEEQMRTAIENNEFVLYYQPQINIETSCISGFEALVRWNNPELGFLPPDEFIPIAEDNHTIIPLGTWVLKEACYFIKRIHALGNTKMKISVNISIVQLFQENFVDIVKNVLVEANLLPEFLEIEITETILMESYDVAYKKLEYLHSMGIGIALDDFGKGYSSLSYLKNLPITTIKIDKSFIDSVLFEGYNKLLTELIISIAQRMKLEIIAEGVEVKEQLDFLKAQKCNTFQGYLVSRPIPEKQIIELLSREWIKN